MNYERLDFSREELATAMRDYYEQLLAFVSIPAFRSVYKKLMDLPPQERPGFVSGVILRREELERRGVEVPEGVLIQTSAFGDRRPTLFVVKKYLPVVVKKYLPEKFHAAWENVNLTFFNEFDNDNIPSDMAHAWRPPLPVALQQTLLASGVDLNSVPEELGINCNLFRRAPEDSSSN